MSASALQIPEKVLSTFPGPLRSGGSAQADRVRGLCGASPRHHSQTDRWYYARRSGRAGGRGCACPLFLFIKEDENFIHASTTPVKERTRAAVNAIQLARDKRGQRPDSSLPISPGAAMKFCESVQAVIEAGANGVMFSESLWAARCGWCARPRSICRIASHLLPQRRHRGKTRGGIWREVIDLLCRA